MLIHSWQCQFFKLPWKNIQQYSLKLNVSMPCWSIVLIFASQDTHYAVYSSIISNSMKIKVESKSPEEGSLTLFVLCIPSTRRDLPCISNKNVTTLFFQQEERGFSPCPSTAPGTEMLQPRSQWETVSTLNSCCSPGWSLFQSSPSQLPTLSSVK